MSYHVDRGKNSAENNAVVATADGKERWKTKRFSGRTIN